MCTSQIFLEGEGIPEMNPLKQKTKTGKMSRRSRREIKLEVRR